MQIRLEKWDEGFGVVETCKFLVANTSLNLIEAKRMCEAMLDGEEPVIEIDSQQLGLELVKSLEKLHVVATLETSSR